MKLRLAAIAAALLLTAGAAQAWWDTAWGYRKSVTIDTSATGADVATPVTAVPVLVRLHTGNFTHFLDVTERGGDIRFLASDDQTVLKHHVERFDAINELAYIWVQVPTIQGGSNANKIWMYFGNAAGVQAEDLVGTYGPSDALVYHYDEAGGAPQDKTVNANNAAAFTGTQNPGSLIGAGARLAGSGRVTINASPTLQMDAAQGWTFSTWIKIDGPQSDAVLMERVDGGKQLVLGIDGTNAYAKFVDEAGTATETPRTAALAPASWHHVALVLGGGKMSVFVDGVEGASIAGSIGSMGGAISIGGAGDNSRFVTADIDETRIANVARTADYLKLATRIEGMDGTGVVYSADETPDTEGASEESHGPSTFGIILNSVFGNEEAIVEQLVIGFCGVMALVAFAVMVLKFIYLSKAKAASAKFLKAYQELGGEQGKGKTIASLYGEDDAYGDSPLFRVYKLGIDEIRKRLQKSNGAAGAAAAKARGAVKPVLTGYDRAAVHGNVAMDLARLQNSDPAEAFAAGARIFAEGDDSRGYMYVVLEGEVDIYVRGKRIDTVGPGACLGEVGLVDKGPRSATAIAKSACRLARLNAKQFQELVRQTPTFALDMMHTLVDRLRLQRDGMETKSIEAVRAALDATMVREGQKMNAQMVLLTIAISGGPFIGLLGTVVGVMVTFAAIAASGDVNINAIAPGMAAALLATVAGLGVAIPALFGYNYLGSMVKEISADMHVFSDEFIARVNEQFGR